jgi:hypothetical protein
LNSPTTNSGALKLRIITAMIRASCHHLKVILMDWISIFMVFVFYRFYGSFINSCVLNKRLFFLKYFLAILCFGSTTIYELVSLSLPFKAIDWCFGILGRVFWSKGSGTYKTARRLIGEKAGVFLKGSPHGLTWIFTRLPVAGWPSKK